MRASSVVVLIGSSGLLGMAAPINNRRDGMTQGSPPPWNGKVFINGKHVPITKGNWLNDPAPGMAGGVAAKPNSPNPNPLAAGFGAPGAQQVSSSPLNEADSISTGSSGSSGRWSPPSLNGNGNNIPKNDFMGSERTQPSITGLKNPSSNTQQNGVISPSVKPNNILASATKNPPSNHNNNFPNQKNVLVPGTNPLPSTQDRNVLNLKAPSASQDRNVLNLKGPSASEMEQWRQKQPVIKKTESFMIDENGSRISSLRGSSSGIQESTVVMRGPNVLGGIQSAGSSSQRGVVVGADRSSMAEGKSSGTLPSVSKLSSQTNTGSSNSASFRSSGLGSGSQPVSQNPMKNVVSKQIPSTGSIGRNTAKIASGTDDATRARIMANSRNDRISVINLKASVPNKASAATVAAAGKLAPRNTEQVDLEETTPNSLVPEGAIPKGLVSEEFVSLEEPTMKGLDSTEVPSAEPISNEQASDKPTPEMVDSEEPAPQEASSDELATQEASSEESASVQQASSEEIGNEEGATAGAAPVDEPKKEGRLKALYRKTKESVKKFLQTGLLQNVAVMATSSVVASVANAAVFGALGIRS